MALDFPSTTGEPTDGSFRTLQDTTLGEVLYAWQGVYWFAIGTAQLGQLADVNIDNGQSQDVLIYNGEQWANERDVDGGQF